MPIASDHWMRLLSNPFLIASFLIGGAQKNCHYVYFKGFVMSPWRGWGVG